MRELLEKKILDQIGFNKILNELELSTPYGKETFYNLSLYKLTQYDELLQELSWIEKTINFISRKNNYLETKRILKKFKNINDIIIKCENGDSLSTVELYEIKYHSYYFNQLKDYLNNNLNINKLLLIDCTNVLDILNDKKESNDLEFHIYDSYSVKLATIRNEKLAIEKKIFKTSNKADQEELFEIRAKITEDERQEELIVRKKLSLELSKIIQNLAINTNKIGYIDLLFEKARIALKYQGVKPQINRESNLLRFEKLKNPYLKQLVENNGNQYQAVDIEVNNGCTVITGANMSGKSSLLKSIFLNVLLAHLGFYVYAEYAEITLMDEIKYINSSIDDPDNGLSSFGYEIKNINEILTLVKEKQMFICIDECFKSTNPVEGQKFVKALVKYLNKANSITIITTHYDKVASCDTKQYQVRGLSHLDDLHINGADVNLLYGLMDYQLEEIDEKTPIPKEAKKVAQLLNIRSDFLRLIDEVDEEGYDE